MEEMVAVVVENDRFRVMELGGTVFGREYDVVLLVMESGGGVGEAVDMVKARLDCETMVYAASVAVAVSVCSPSPSAVVVAKLQLPFAPTVTEPMAVPFSRMITRLPASAVPLKNGVLSLVDPPLVIGVTVLPLLLPAFNVRPVGATVSITTVELVERTLVLPARSVARTAMV